MILWIRLSSDFSFLVVVIWSEFENVPSVGGTLPFSRSGFCWSGNEKSDLKTNLCYLLLEKKKKNVSDPVPLKTGTLNSLLRKCQIVRFSYVALYYPFLFSVCVRLWDSPTAVCPCWGPSGCCGCWSWWGSCQLWGDSWWSSWRPWTMWPRSACCSCSSSSSSGEG